MIEFKIRPDKWGKWKCKGGFFRVMVMDSSRAVKKRYKDEGGEGNDTTAFMICNDLGLDLGTIVFPPKFGISIMTHEAAHAALRFISWQVAGVARGKKANGTSDEDICQAVGNICREITRGLYREGVWK